VGENTLNHEVRNFSKRYKGIRLQDGSFKNHGSGSNNGLFEVDF